MSRQEAEIIKSLKALVASAPVLIPAKVVKVDGENRTCDVTDLEGFVWYNVRLQAVSPFDTGFFLLPEIDSDVIIGRIDNTENFCVLAYSKIQDADIRISGKYVMANSTENLFDLVNTLLDTLSQAVITTPAGPGNFAPQTVNRLTELKTHFGNLLKKE